VDNILKALLGVLSVAGLAALSVPERDPVAAKEVVPQAATERTATVVQAAARVPASYAPPFASANTPDLKIGTPAIDGRPLDPNFGMPFGVSLQNPTTSGDVPPSAQGGYTPPAFIMPGSEASPNPDAMAGGAELITR